MLCKKSSHIENFKNLMLKSNQLDNNVFDLKSLKFNDVALKNKSVNKQVFKAEKSSYVLNDLQDDLDQIVLSVEDSDGVFDVYQKLYEEVLDQMVLNNDVSDFPAFFKKILTEFSRIPEFGDTPKNSLDEAYILHSRLIVPKILNYYWLNIKNKDFARSLLELTIHLAHYILLPYPDKDLKRLPVKRPIPERESNKTLHNKSWQDQAYNDYLDIYDSLRGIAQTDEIQIMKAILLDLKNPKENLSVALRIEDDENLNESIMNENEIGEKIIRSSDFDSILTLFKKMFFNNVDYCLEDLLGQIHELIANTKPRKDLDIMLFKFSQALIEVYIQNGYKNIKALENALKYSSSISANTISCFCGKYGDDKYYGITCDRCDVKIEKGGLQYASFEYILRKLKAEEVYKDSVFLSKGFPNYYMYKKKGNTRFIEMIDNQVVSLFCDYTLKISDKIKRNKIFFSLIEITQSKGYTIREGLIDYFRACQSDSVEEYLSKCNTTINKWAIKNLTISTCERINYYEDYHEEKLLSLNDESLWDEIRILDHVLLNTDFFFGEEETSTPYDEIDTNELAYKHENFLYDKTTEYEYSNKYIFKTIEKYFEKLELNGFKNDGFCSVIGSFYCNMINKYKRDFNVKEMNICIADFMESINKNGDKAIDDFVKIILDLKKSDEIILALKNIRDNYKAANLINYIIVNTDTNYCLLLSNLYKENLESDFVSLSQKFDEMSNEQVFKYLFQFSENVTALKSFLNHHTNLKLGMDE